LCKRALGYQAYNYNMVNRILKKGWDKLDENLEEQIEIPDHHIYEYTNIRTNETIKALRYDKSL